MLRLTLKKKVGRIGGKGVETEVSEETRLFQQLARVHSHGDSDAASLLPLGSPAISRNVPEHVVLGCAYVMYYFICVARIAVSRIAYRCFPCILSVMCVCR